MLQLNEIDERDQQVVVATLLRRLYQARMDTERGKGIRRNLPALSCLCASGRGPPLCPRWNGRSFHQHLKQVLAEGRKFGIGVGLISQRPGKLNSDVLSQCQTQCIMRIVNEIDQKSVASAIEGVGVTLKQFARSVERAGDRGRSAVNTPVICRVRSRFTRHGGESKDAPDMWQNYFSPEKQESRQRNEAPLNNNNKAFNLLR